MSSDLSLTKIRLGSNADTSKNFVISVPDTPDGTLTIERGNGTDVLTVDSAGVITTSGKIAVPAQSMVRLNTANWYGSTNTKIRRFTNVVTNQGTDITYVDSATLGASFTVNTAGVYAISYCDQFSVPTYMGLSLNAAALTTDIHAIPATDILVAGVASGADWAACVSWCGYLTVGAIVRAHTAWAASGTNVNVCQFTITKVA